MVHVTLKQAASHDDHFIAYCGNHLCDHRAVLECAPLLARYGESCNLDLVLSRLRCGLCGHLGATMRLASHDAARPAKPLFDPVTGKRLVE